MYNYYNYFLQDEHQTWRSANQIEIAALEHENRRIQMLPEDAAAFKPRGVSLLSFLKARLKGLAG